MKDIVEPIPAERAPESEAFGNRRLIRPSLNRNGNDHNHAPAAASYERRDRAERPERAERSERAERNDRNDRDRGDRGERDRSERNDRNGHHERGGSMAAKKGTPPEQTNAENFYYQKQMQSKTAMVIVLRDGEEVHGIIEWYDKNCIKVNRNSGPNLMIYKPSIKYMYKEGENSRS